ncbi:hypothetical protein RHMOL_Rhmol09G0243700 [Rhododendron molle]|uniref:Uncharacterized protein n=1 Tax=Rhododendron molle TaxID=49168 RepID=A0ACC0MGT6_RHOML|nr:hypothetical protein RHMOL_Rhmol09G0243700 [Rhododendron molle]
MSSSRSYQPLNFLEESCPCSCKCYYVLCPFACNSSVALLFDLSVTTSNSLMQEGGGDPPKGSLGLAIDKHFGSLESLIVNMNAEGAAFSGWVWLGLDREFNRLLVETTENQDPLVTKGANLVPLLGIDVWEHAYHLQYKNVKPDYLKSIWHVMNWKYASEVYETECP